MFKTKVYDAVELEKASVAVTVKVKDKASYVVTSEASNEITPVPVSNENAASALSPVRA